MTESWLILADDLTGASDCAIAFAARGRVSVVGWGEAAAPDEAEVFAYDADSRGLPEATAAERHRAALARLLKDGRRLFKKIDSTLRGHIARETVEALAATENALGIFAPAFPATRRTTRDGRVLVKGEPLESTELWRRDHSYPTADLAEMLATAGLKGEKLPLAVIRSEDRLQRSLADLAGLGDRIAICDAETDEDLARIAAASLTLGDGVFYIGSAGLAHALAAATPVPQPDPWHFTATGKGTLIVVGSLAEASRDSARQLARSPGLRYLPVEPEALLTGTAEAAFLDGIIAGLDAGADVLVEIRTGAAPDLSIGPRLVEALAALLRPAASHIGALAATGGETAAALLSRFGVTGLRLVEEIEPGVALGLSLGALAIPVATKAGAFGDAGSLARIAARLHRIQQEEAL